VAVIQSYRPVVGGAQLQLERLLPLLSQRGVEVTVLTKRVRGYPRVERMAAATVRRLALPGASSLSSLAFIALCLAYIARRRRRTDIVHAYGALSEGIVALGASAMGLPAVVRILRAGELGDLERLSSKPAGGWRWGCLAQRAWFIALSVEGRAELVHAGVPEARAARIPNGVELSVFRPAQPVERRRLRESLGLPVEAPVAVFAGRVWPEKQLHLVVDALAAIPNLMLAVIGEGPELEPLRARARAAGVAERVRFAGVTDDVADYLRSADIFVLPSRSEGMSNSLLEAMACGLACAATPVSGVPELLGAGRGLLVPPSGEAWRGALSRLAEDGELRARLGARAASLVRQSHSIGMTADLTVSLYEQVLAGRTVR
jgi:glycosyltransferase involved in cell wall biosynthesis